ncbi:MAG: hypothetical protein ACTSR0_03930 [Candidatus Asgardarchaeia archaeon]
MVYLLEIRKWDIDYKLLLLRILKFMSLKYRRVSVLHLDDHSELTFYTPDKPVMVLKIHDRWYEEKLLNALRNAGVKVRILN